MVSASFFLMLSLDKRGSPRPAVFETFEGFSDEFPCSPERRSCNIGIRFGKAALAAPRPVLKTGISGESASTDTGA